LEKNIFDLAHAGKIDSWAYRWLFSCLLREGLTVLPSKNLVKNIGIGENSTHTKGGEGWISRMPLEAISFPLINSEKIERDIVADRWTDLNVIGTRTSITKKIRNKIHAIARVNKRLLSFLR